MMRAVKSSTVVLEILKPLAVIVEEQKHKKNTRHSYEDAVSDNDVDTDASTTSAPLTISFTNKVMDTESFEVSNDIYDNKTTTTSSSSPPASRTSSASTENSTTRKLKHFVFREIQL